MLLPIHSAKVILNNYDENTKKALLIKDYVTYEVFLGLPLKDDFEIVLNTIYEVFLDIRINSQSDKMTVYAFFYRDIREIFRCFLLVPGLGPALAFNIVENKSPFELFKALKDKNEKYFLSIKGVGQSMVNKIFSCKKLIKALSKEGY